MRGAGNYWPLSYRKMKNESKHMSWLILLWRWFTGDATLRDEQALEALAKEDPFVAEALEGYRLQPEDDHALALTRLKARLRQRYGKKRRGIVFYAIRAAAAGIVLVAAWVVLQQFNPSEINQGSIAEVKKEEAPVPADSSTNAAGPVIPGEAKTVEVPPQKTVAENKAVPPLKNNELPTVFTFADSASSIAGADAAPAAPLAERIAGDFQPDIAQAQKESKRHIAGLVTDASGVPLIGVSVFDENSSRGAVTDVDGNFSMDVGNSTKMLSLSYTGYENQEIHLGPQSFVNVQMVESSEQLSEVNVTGQSARKAKKNLAEATTPPSPKGGFKKLERYLRGNLRYPEAAARNGVEGVVKLRFRVEDDGRLTGFEVQTSLGSGLDEEAKRLLKEGPKWAPAGVAVYSIAFKL